MPAKDVAASKVYLQGALAQNIPLAVQPSGDGFPIINGSQPKSSHLNPANKPEENSGSPGVFSSTDPNYQALDAELNAVYKKIHSSLSLENQSKLKDWQMAWITIKDRVAQKVSSPAQKEKMLAEFTKDRLQELQELLTGVQKTMKDNILREYQFLQAFFLILSET